MAEFCAPRVWPSPQWACDTDVLDFGSVRPEHPVEKALLVQNVGAGTQPLQATLRSRGPWLQLRAGEASEWAESVALQLAPGERALLLCRAHPAHFEGEGGGVAELEVQTAEAILNAPSSIQARAHFLPPRHLLLEWVPPAAAPVADPGSVAAPPAIGFVPDTEAASSSNGSQGAGGNQAGRVLALRCEWAPLGSEPGARLRLRRSDGQPVRVSTEAMRVHRGKPQWVGCRIEDEGEGQALSVFFFTANRAAGQSYEVELELRDADDLVEPARLILSVAVSRPPLLGFEPLSLMVGKGLQSGESLTLRNEGEGRLQVDFLQVPGQCRSWLSVQDPGDFALGAGENVGVQVTVNTKALGVGRVKGAVEVHCNHQGRRVARRVPVMLEVTPFAVRIVRQAAEWTRSLSHGESTSCSLTLSSEASEPMDVHLTAWDPSLAPGARPWLWIEPAQRLLHLLPGAAVEAKVQVDTRRLAAPKAPAQVVGWVAVSTGQQGEVMLWQEKITLDLRPRARRWGLF